MRKQIPVFILSNVLLIVGGCGGPLLLRIYFLHGGKLLWLSTVLQTCGFPITLISLIVSYFCRRKADGPNTNLVFMKFPMLASSVFLGVLYGLGSFLYAIGQDFLPVSTLVIIYSTQLAFTALFAFLILKQNFTIFTLVSVILMVAGGAFLAVDSGSAKTKGETNFHFVLGIIMTFLCAVLTGLLTPLIQLVYIKSNTEIFYSLVMEMQLMISVFATIVAIIAMLATNTFQTIPQEARSFELGKAKYYLVIISTAILFQFVLLGVVGIVFSSSALLSGIIGTVLLPVSEVLAVICLHEDFTVGKGVSLGLCLLGFTSYYYGEIIQNKKSSLTDKDVSQLLLP